MSWKKNDNGKPRPDLIPAGFLLEAGEIMSFGAQKYGEENWKNCEDTQRYKAALLRHVLAYLSGEIVDPESGKSHLSHICCNSGFLWHFDQAEAIANEIVETMEEETKNTEFHPWINVRK